MPKTVAVVAVLGVVAVVATVGGLVALLSSGAPEEVRPRAYAREFCPPFEEQVDVTNEAAESYWTIYDQLYDWDSEAIDGSSSRQRERFSDAAQAYLEGVRGLYVLTGEFAEGHQLRGPGGEDLREDLLEWAADQRDGLDEVLAELRRVDLSDGDDAMEDIADIVDGATGTDTFPYSDEAAQLSDALEGQGESCFLMDFHGAG